MLDSAIRASAARLHQPEITKENFKYVEKTKSSLASSP